MARKKNLGGRPKVKIDWLMVDNLAQIQCTCEEVIIFTGISGDTFERACKREKHSGFAEYLKLKRRIGHVSLRRKQFQIALEGDKTMLIWLGKQYLNQSDKVEQKETKRHIIQLAYALDEQDKKEIKMETAG